MLRDLSCELIKELFSRSHCSGSCNKFPDCELWGNDTGNILTSDVMKTECKLCAVQSPLNQLQEAQILVEIFPHRFESLWLCSVLAMEEKQVVAVVEAASNSVLLYQRYYPHIMLHADAAASCCS